MTVPSRDGVPVPPVKRPGNLRPPYPQRWARWLWAHRWGVIGLWVAVLLVASPTAVLYTHSITYSQSTNGTRGASPNKPRTFSPRPIPRTPRSTSSWSAPR